MADDKNIKSPGYSGSRYRAGNRAAAGFQSRTGETGAKGRTTPGCRQETGTRSGFP